MNRDIVWTNQFKKDYKLAQKRHLDIDLLDNIIRTLSHGEPLPEKNRDHALTGDWIGHRECHIQPDWLLIYRIEDNVLVLTLARTGYRLVQAARAAGIRVSPVPGPCALIAALSVAGLPSDRFAFEGFLPAKASARRERLAALAGETRTLVFYESAHRIEESLADLCAAFGGERPAVLARELTKLFETVLDGTLANLQSRVQADPDQRKGEFVLVVQGMGEDADAKLAEGRRVHAILARQLPPSAAAKLAAEITGAPRKALYGG